MKKSLNVSVDEALLADAQQVLDGLGISLSAAVTMLLRHAVQHKRLPGELVHPMHDVAIAGGAGAELRAEILLELMSTVIARLDRMAAEALDPAEKTRIATVRDVLLKKRFAFDPHDGAQIDALMREFSGHAATLAAAHDARHRG